MKLAVGIPSRRNDVFVDTAVCIAKLAMNYQEAIGQDLDIIHATGRTEICRNDIAERAYTNGLTHLLFIDTDMTFPADGWLTLINEDKDIIGCNAAKRITGAPVFDTNLEGQKLDYIQHDIEEVDFVGMAFTMIKTEVFAAMEMPWFRAPAIEGQNRIVSEDVAFCRIARKLYDYQVFTHNALSLQIGHIGYDTRYLYPHVQKQVAEYEHKLKHKPFFDEIRRLKNVHSG